MVRTAIYARKSKRDEDSDSVALQLLKCKKAASDNGWEVVFEDADDGKSGWAKGVKRRGYERLLATINADGVEQVLVAWHDRLFRQDKERLRFYEVCMAAHMYIIVDAAGSRIDLRTADGKKAFRDAGSAAQHYSDLLSEKLREQRAPQAAAGRRQGGGRRGFGYRWVPPVWPEKRGHLEVDEREAEAIREVARRLLDGGSLYGCCAWLNEQGITTPEGNGWRVGNLKRMMIRPFLAAVREHWSRNPLIEDSQRVRVGTADGDWPAILDKRTHERLVKRLTSEGLGKGPRPAARSYMLSGLLRCSGCGGPLSGSGGRYVCDHRGSATCPARARVDARSVERMVIDRAWTLALLAAERPPEAPAEDHREEDTLAEIDRLEGKLKAYAEMLGRDEMTPEQFSTATRETRERVADLKASVERTEPEAETPDLAEMEAEWQRWAEYEETGKGLDDTDLDRMRDHVRAVVRAVKVSSTSASPKAFKPETVEIVGRTGVNV